MIIGLSGKAGAGKDTIGDLLVREHGYVKASFAAPLKDLACKIDPDLAAFVARHGWDEAKQMEHVRLLLQRLGQGVRDLDEQFWVKLGEQFVYEQMAAQGTMHPRVVFCDVRYLNEVQFIRAGGGRLWRVVRPSAGLEGEAGDHPSETELDEVKPNVTLHNVGPLESLSTVVASFL